MTYHSLPIRFGFTSKGNASMMHIDKSAKTASTTMPMLLPTPDFVDNAFNPVQQVDSCIKHATGKNKTYKEIHVPPPTLEGTTRSACDGVR